MGCYPSRADVTALSGNQPALSPHASPTPVAGCCAIGVKGQPASDHAKLDQQGQTATKSTKNGWVNGDGNAESTTPGDPSCAETTATDQAGKDAQAKASSPTEPNQTSVLPGAMGEEQSDPSANAGIADKQAPEGLSEPPTPSKYKAFVPVRGEYVPVVAALEDNGNIDFDAEKQAIEAQFCVLEKALDEGTMERSEIERQFEVLTNQAARLRRLQAAAHARDASTDSSEPASSKPPVKLAPVAPPAQLAPLAPPKTLAPLAAAEGASATPTMAVVHWKGVTKKKFVVYRDAIIAKYGEGPDGIKNIERIPNRILITAPAAEVMIQILADETLDPRPEPYRLPGGNSAPKPASGLSKPGALQANASSLLAPPDGLAPLRSPSSNAQVRAASPFAR